MITSPETGSLVAVMGSSGSGKTTFMNFLTGNIVDLRLRFLINLIVKLFSTDSFVMFGYIDDYKLKQCDVEVE